MDDLLRLSADVCSVDEPFDERLMPILFLRLLKERIVVVYGIKCSTKIT